MIQLLTWLTYRYPTNFPLVVICRCPMNLFSSVSQLELSCWPHRLIMVVSIELSLQANYVSHKRDLTNMAQKSSCQRPSGWGAGACYMSRLGDFIDCESCLGETLCTGCCVACSLVLSALSAPSLFGSRPLVRTRAPSRCCHGVAPYQLDRVSL